MTEEQPGVREFGNSGHLARFSRDVGHHSSKTRNLKSGPQRSLSYFDVPPRKVRGPTWDQSQLRLSVSEFAQRCPETDSAD